MSSSLSSVFFGVEIPETLLASEMQNHQSGSLKESRQMAGRALAAKAVLLAKGETLGLDFEQEFDENGLQETEEEALMRTVLSEEVVPTPLDASTVRNIYDSQPDGFTTAPLIEASHILITPREDNQTAWQAAKDQATEILKLLKKAPKKFVSLARTVSNCPSSENGGSLGQLRPGDLMQGIWDVLLTLNINEISNIPIKSKHGWHILKLDHRVDGQRLPFEHVKDHIEAQLEVRAWTVAAAKYVDALLRENAKHTPVLAINDTGQLDRQSSGAGKIKTVLGDVFSKPAAAFHLVDSDTLSILETKSAELNNSPKDVFEAAIPGFLTHADDEAWAKIVSYLRESDNPLQECLAVIVKHQCPIKKKPSRRLDIGLNRNQKPAEGKYHDHYC